MGDVGICEPIHQQQNATSAEGRSQWPLQIVPVLASPIADPETATSEGWRTQNEHNPVDAWLPLTESRRGNAFTSAFHLLCSGIGLQALALPLAFSALGWFWGILSLSIAFAWQLYTIWLLVHLHESPSKARYSRYLRLAILAFGEKLGNLLAVFPVMYLSGGTCVTLIITGGSTMKALYQVMCPGSACVEKALSTVEWFLVFTCLAILAALIFPNLNSTAWISLIGAMTAMVYCTLLWALSVNMGRPEGVSHDPSKVASSEVAKTRSVLAALGIIALAFRGHNLVLEIQGTVLSSPRHPSHKTMWRAVRISYLLISLILFPLAIGGYWVYGNSIATDGEMLIAFSRNMNVHKASKLVIISIHLLVLLSCFCSFQIYGMIVFDNLEFKYIVKKKKPCPRWLRLSIRIFFGGIAFLMSVAFPFLPNLGALIGGITLPLTYAFPCFMWITLKKPPQNSTSWWFNLFLGCSGIILCVVSVTAAAWSIATNGLNGNFFHPH